MSDHDLTKKSTIARLRAGLISVAGALVLLGTSGRALAQVTPVDQSAAGKIEPGNTEEYGNLLPKGVESRGQAIKRLRAYKPDRVKYPVPRTKWDGKPDLSGVWWPGTTLGKPAVPLGAMYKNDPQSKALRERTDFINWKNGYENPTFHCWPRSPLDGSVGVNGDLQLVQAPGILLVLDEEDHRFRVIPIDGGPHDPNAKPSFMGDSVGHWEGDTLVVDVTTFNGKPWLGGGDPPQTSSDGLHLVERWSRPDAKIIEYQVTVEDQKLLKGPWTSPAQRRGKMPFEIIQESLCMEEPDLAKREEAAARLREQQGLPRNAVEAQQVLEERAKKQEAAGKKK